MNPRQIITTAHQEDCDIREWVSPTYQWLRRDRIGRPRHNVMTAFLVFRCNNSDCPAQMIMPWSEAQKALGINSPSESLKRKGPR